MDMDLEVVVLPVADVDRAKNFYKTTMGVGPVKLIRVYGTERKEWQPIILENIAPEQIRKRFGGNKPDN